MRDIVRDVKRRFDGFDYIDFFFIVLLTIVVVVFVYLIAATVGVSADAEDTPIDPLDYVPFTVPEMGASCVYFPSTQHYECCCGSGCSLSVSPGDSPFYVPDPDPTRRPEDPTRQPRPTDPVKTKKPDPTQTRAPGPTPTRSPDPTRTPIPTVTPSPPPTRPPNPTQTPEPTDLPWGGGCLCHKDVKANGAVCWLTKCFSDNQRSAYDAHLAHGDTPGSCSTDKEGCKKTPPNP